MVGGREGQVGVGPCRKARGRCPGLKRWAQGQSPLSQAPSMGKRSFNVAFTPPSKSMLFPVHTLGGRALRGGRGPQQLSGEAPGRVLETAWTPARSSQSRREETSQCPPHSREEECVQTAGMCSRQPG